MSKYTKDLKSERRDKVVQMSRIMGNGSITNADRSKFDELKQDVDSLDAKIARVDNYRAEDYPDAGSWPIGDNQVYRDSSTGGIVHVRDKAPSMRDLKKARRNYRRTPEDAAFSAYLRTGHVGGELRVNPEMRADGAGLSTGPNSAGWSAGATGSDTGGYLVPFSFLSQLAIAQKQFGGLEQDMKQISTDDGRPMPFPAIDYTGVVGTVMAGEVNQILPTTVYNFGEGIMNAWTTISPLTLASLQLAEDSAFDLDLFVANALGESVGRKIAALAVSGTGNGQHLGVTTAVAARGAWAGVGTSGGYVQNTVNATVPVLGNTTGVAKLTNGIFEASDLLNLITAVDPAYRNMPGTKFYMHDNDMKTVRRLTDGFGQPLFKDPATGGQLSIFGYPVQLDNNVAPVGTVANTVAGPIFGHLGSAFYLRTVNRPKLLRLTERFADYLSLGYLLYTRGDCRSADMRAVTQMMSSTS